MMPFPCADLAPRPKRIEITGRGPILPRSVVVRLPDRPELAVRARRFADALAPLGHVVATTGHTVAPTGAECDVDLRIDAACGDRPESYAISIRARSIAIVARDAIGASRAFDTLAQIVRLARAAEGSATTTLPALEIEDAPDFPARGVMLDVSRTKVPTQATLFALVDRLASFKVNQLQLYTEHTFAYAGHEVVWRDASPLSRADVLALDAHCRARDVELVPNQQSFGHMHRWLVHEPYRALAEVPEGIDHAFSRAREPYGLCPLDPGSLALLEDLYDQLLPCFTSALFNTGLDETIDLGLGRSRAACEERGTARVYLDFLCAVADRVRARGRRMQFWGDVLVRHPELCREIPRDAIALEWGYDADHPFAERLAVFAASGLEFHVCPGTSSWQSVAGRTQNMLANLGQAAVEGRKAGARGYLVSDWGDRGHLQPLSATSPGLLAGACLAWNADDALDRARLAARLDAHVFEDPARVLGSVVCELGDAYLEAESPSTNGSVLFFLLAFADAPLPHARMPGLAVGGLERALAFVLERSARIDGARPRAPDAATLLDEARWTADLLAFACRFGIARLKTEAGAAIGAIDRLGRRAFVDELAPLVDEHRRLWLERNRPGGLEESAGWLERVLDDLSV